MKTIFRAAIIFSFVNFFMVTAALATVAPPGGVPFKGEISSFEGIKLEVVEEGTAAYKCGLRNGDIIVAINNQKVTTAKDLSVLFDAIAKGKEAKLTLYRNGKLIERTLSPVPQSDTCKSVC